MLCFDSCPSPAVAPEPPLRLILYSPDGDGSVAEEEPCDPIVPSEHTATLSVGGGVVVRPIGGLLPWTVRLDGPKAASPHEEHAIDRTSRECPRRSALQLVEQLRSLFGLEPAPTGRTAALDVASVQLGCALPRLACVSTVWLISGATLVPHHRCIYFHLSLVEDELRATSGVSTAFAARESIAAHAGVAKVYANEAVELMAQGRLSDACAHASMASAEAKRASRHPHIE